MTSNSDKSENDDVSLAFDIVKTAEANIDDGTLTANDEDESTNFDTMTTDNWERNPIRRVNVIGGPQSAFARLFPEKYRQEEEEVRSQQRSKSIDIQHGTSDDENEQEQQHQTQMRKSRRVRFYTDEDDHRLQTRTKSESYLNQLHLNTDLNYDPNPEIIYRDNPDKLIYTQKVAIRYLKPPTPPPPGPIVIREIQSKPPNEPPPLCCFFYPVSFFSQTKEKNLIFFIASKDQFHLVLHHH